MSTVKLSINGAIAHITIARAQKYNALTSAMWQEILDHCQHLANEVKPKVVIISAEGDKAFCAGADIVELTETIQSSSALIKNNELVQKAQQAIENLPCATIAQINGTCLGGGLGIALSCDFRVSADHATFAITPAKLGLLYSVEDTRRVVNTLGVARAKQLLFLGQKINAERAEQWGLVNQVVPLAELTKATEQLAEQLLAASSQSIAGIKSTIGFLTRANSLSETDIRPLFNQAFKSDDFAEGSQAFLDKRTPEFK